MDPVSRIGTLALLFVGTLLGAGTASAQTLRIFHIDVDQGDATLFVAPGGGTLLVDSGKNGHGSRIKAVMQAAGVSSLDHVVTTHYHEDHYGGIDELNSDPEITVGEAFDRGDKDFLPKAKKSQDRFVEYENSVGSGATHLMRGETIALDPKMTVTTISSGGAVLGEQNATSGHDENDMSVSLLIQWGDFRYFVGGDIEHFTEGKIADRDLVLDVDVYQANHHGSDTSSSANFLADLRPSVIVISNGNHGGHKHPRQSTLTAYSQLNPAPTVFQTNKYLKGGTGGNVADSLIADLDPDGSEGTIALTVDRSAGSYTVAYRDQEHTFSIKEVSPAEPGSIVIESLLPNPVGSDRDLETVTLQNPGAASVTMAGWVLRDSDGRVWPLVSLGEIAAGSSATIVRDGMPMSLNNAGDTIEVVNASGEVVDSFTYATSSEGAEIETGH